jgi:hypothetical protein
MLVLAQGLPPLLLVLLLLLLLLLLLYCGVWLYRKVPAVPAVSVVLPHETGGHNQAPHHGSHCSAWQQQQTPCWL